MKFKIERCYDSHVHLLPTGELRSVPQFQGVGDLEKWKQAIEAMPLRRGWRMAFGWDPEAFPELSQLNAQDLELLSPGIPLIVSRRDGHSGCLNETALKKLNSPRGAVQGRVNEEDYFAVLKALPAAGPEERRGYLLEAQKHFLEQGFTHLREMMGDLHLLEALTELDSEPDWHLQTEVFLHHSPGSGINIEEILASGRRFNQQKLKKSRVLGVKFFLDGALGSETALLSYPYEGHSHCGSGLWPVADLKKDLREVWRTGARAAVHCIGDASLQQILEVAQSLARESMRGGLSIEHAELIHPRSYEYMEDLDLEFHFQPSHFLSDQKWLREKLGERWSWCFPWKKIEEMGFPIFFGSDSPIESPSLSRTRQGLNEAAVAGIPACEIDWKFAHSHPDANWGKKTWSEVSEEGEVLRVFVEGKEIFRSSPE